MLTAFHKSTIILTATLTNAAGTALTGATVTVTILDMDGTALVTGATMVDQSDGTYDFTIINTLLPTAGDTYTAQITAVSGTNTRFAEVPIKTEVDVD